MFCLKRQLTQVRAPGYGETLSFKNIYSNTTSEYLSPVFVFIIVSGDRFRPCPPPPPYYVVYSFLSRSSSAFMIPQFLVSVSGVTTKPINLVGRSRVGESMGCEEDAF